MSITSDVAAPKQLLIKAQSKSNGLTTSIFGVGLLLTGFITLKILPNELAIAGFVIVCLGIIASIIGYYKLKEPDYAMTIDEKGILYQHRYGQWFIYWDNVQRIDVPRASRGLDLIDLHLVGIKLKTYPEFLHTVSQRLMTNMLMEQRPLLAHNNDDGCATGFCAGEDLVLKGKVKLADGTVLTGVKAMFVQRMTLLRKRLGFDIYINEAELDRAPKDFVALLRACQSDVISNRR